nr:hypothetical protein [uncultured bacterium]
MYPFYDVTVDTVFENDSTSFEVLENLFNGDSSGWRKIDFVDYKIHGIEPIWTNLFTLIGSVGSPSYDPLIGLEAEDHSFSGFLSSRNNSSALNFRRGPLPMLEWLYSDGHGRGQSFGFRASASVNTNEHYDVRYIRTQTRGTLVNESYLRDDLLLKTMVIRPKIGLKWIAFVRYQSGESSETGGLLDKTQLDSNLFNWNRELVTTRFSNDVNSLYKALSWEACMSTVNLSDSKYQYHFRSSGFFHNKIFDAPSLMINDSLESQKSRTEFSISRSGLNEKVYFSLGVQNRLQSRNSIDSANGIIWDPYLSLRNAVFDLEYRPLSASYNFSIGPVNLLKEILFSSINVKRKLPSFWSGQLQENVSYQSGVIFLKQKHTRLSSSLLLSQGDNVLINSINSNDAVWGFREGYSVLKFSIIGDLAKSFKYKLHYSLASRLDLGIAPWFGELFYSKEWSLNPNTSIFFGINASGWAGKWNRPFYIPERGTFAFNNSVIQNDKLLSGLISPFVGVRFKSEAEIILNFQNVNQGWLPNTVFLVENYPSPPLALRVTGRWRMFN